VAEKTRTALVAVSRPGACLALRLQPSLAEAEIWLPEQILPDDAVTAHRWHGHLSDFVPGLFGEYAAIVFFGSVGMAARLIAPSVKNKDSDPAVVVVDDAGRFVVSVLSGHVGGANALAKRVAALLEAVAVITTASEALETIAVDLLGVEFGWLIDGRENLTGVSAAMVNGEMVGLVQEAGERDWWPLSKSLPSNVVQFANYERLWASGCSSALLITDRDVKGYRDAMPATVVYRPRSLVIGIGCNQGTPAYEIRDAVNTTMKDHGLSPMSIRNLATIDVKRAEAGLCELAKQLDVPIVYFAAPELDGITRLPNPSNTVRGWVGALGVCEPAALLSSGAAALLVAKRKTKNLTVAVARVEHSRKRGVSL
jgi:cobalt-precorrin 5A hydrolase